MIENIPEKEEYGNKWTQFSDMHSGGGTKVGFEVILIEAGYDEATEIFEERFGRSPFGTTCDCCGPDFDIDTHDTLDEAIKHTYERRYKGESIEKYCNRDDVLVMKREGK